MKEIKAIFNVYDDIIEIIREYESRCGKMVGE